MKKYKLSLSYTVVSKALGFSTLSGDSDTANG